MFNPKKWREEHNLVLPEEYQKEVRNLLYVILMVGFVSGYFISKI